MIFLHRLALHLGEPDVGALAGRLTVAQILTWMDYDALEPIGSTFHPSDVTDTKKRVTDPKQMAAIAAQVFGGNNGR